MGTQTSREKLTGTKVQSLDIRRGAIVDSAQNQPLYDEISGDDLPIPKGWLVVLRDATDGDVVKLGTGGPWSEGIALGGDSGSGFDPTAIDGYDAGEVQTLKNNSGTLEWVTDTP